MRANSSLISHILGSHPQISGYYEMHQSYLSENDLLIQKERYLSRDNIKNGTVYLFDKLLHNKYQLKLEALGLESPGLEKLELNTIKILVAIRPPEQSIKSIINLFRKKKSAHPYADPKLAIEYYNNRILQLAQFCEHYKNCYYYYDADFIRTEPQKSLLTIQHWLSLQSPLNEQYQIFSQTGLARAGDSSDNMKKGTIIKKQSNYDAIEIPSTILSTIIKNTAKYRQAIINNAKESLVLERS